MDIALWAMDLEKGETEMTKPSMTWGIAIAILLPLAGSVLADDLNPPPWRGQPDSTFQMWEFSTNTRLDIVADQYFNPYGVPEADILAGYWIDTYQGHQGMWMLSGILDLTIPNTPPHPQMPKTIWIQMTWTPDPLVPSAVPEVIVLPDEYNGEVEAAVVSDMLLSGPWHLTTWQAVLPNNPPLEILRVTCPTVVDEIVVDTIPEPASMAMLGIGVVSILIRRRKT